MSVAIRERESSIYKQTSKQQLKTIFLSFEKGTCHTRITEQNCTQRQLRTGRGTNQDNAHTHLPFVRICFSNQMVWFIHTVRLRVVQGKISSF